MTCKTKFLQNNFNYVLKALTHTLTRIWSKINYPHVKVFILSIYGLLSEQIDNALIVPFCELFNSEWFQSSGSLRNVWLTVVTEIYRSNRIKLGSMIDYLRTLSSDNSLFVRRLTYRIWAEIINETSIGQVSSVLNEDSKLTKEVLIQLKLANRLKTIDQVVNQLCSINGTFLKFKVQV